ncbi:hypothetical protein C8R45DRAFT_1087593 [Mycena sanguinolenta]|nr:hypothetical protein C8R45DRAFT_1087593 [Mycena sanguinolenta]
MEEPELLSIFSDLNKNEIFQWSQKSVAKLLQKYAGHLHICVDGWTSPQVISFLDIIFIQYGKIESIILDFVKASKSHIGIYLASHIAECLRKYGVQDKILAIFVDNTETLALRLMGEICVDGLLLKVKNTQHTHNTHNVRLLIKEVFI